MGKNITKIEYTCDMIHEAYTTGCGEKSAFILVLHRTTDYWALFHRTHNEELQKIGSFTDAQINALQKIFSDPGNHNIGQCNKLTKEEINAIDTKLFING